MAQVATSPTARSRPSSPWMVAVLTLLAIVLSWPSAADAAGTVTNCASYGDPGTPGDLAWALQGGGTVTFACSGTIVVPELMLMADTTLDATGRTVVLSGNGASRVLWVYVGVTAELKTITVANGNSDEDKGGGIYNRGTLTLTNSTVSGNSAQGGGGISNQYGTVTLVNSAVTDNDASLSGGGIQNTFGTLTLIKSTVSANEAFENGGGIANFGGTLIIAGGTISGNTGGFVGGAIFNDTGGSVTLSSTTVSNNGSNESGGGIFNLDGVLSLTNSTVSGNVAGWGGGILNRGNLDLTNSTVSGNSAEVEGGGIYNNGGTVTLMSSIIAQQSPGADCSGAISSLGYNLDSDATCQLTASGDISAGIADLQPLAMNPPGTTATHALGSSSQALDAIPLGANGCGTEIATDQRGVTRPQGAGCDMGAYEKEVPTTCPATTALEGTPDGAVGLSTLYAFRKTVLAATPTGQRYISLFYKHSVEAVWLMLRYPALRTSSRLLLERYLPTLRALVEGRSASLTRRDLVTIDTLLAAFAMRASAGFRADLQAIRQELWQPTVLGEFGITITRDW